MMLLTVELCVLVLFDRCIYVVGMHDIPLLHNFFIITRSDKQYTASNLKACNSQFMNFVSYILTILALYFTLSQVVT